MTKYTIHFGLDLKNNYSFINEEKCAYYDNKGNKTIGDVKDFITCFNDNICTCMLNAYRASKGTFYNSYSKIDLKDEDKEDEQKLKEIAQDSEIFIAQTKKVCSCKILSENKELFSLQKKSLISKINNLEKKEELKEYRPENFYDIVIDVNSIININNGWNIEMEDNGLQKYKDYKNEDLIKIGIVGNINKGKSFILSKISRIKLPTGTSISTKGLSIKYPKLDDGYTNRKFILLDSAGLETPVLNEERQNNNNVNQEIEVNEEEGKKEENKGTRNEEFEFRLKARDILITESFLQSFIISTSDLLLVVIDKLSFSEQKLLNKIKRESKIRKEKKKIFIIHNLKTYRTIKQVEEYISEILLKSATFKLRKGDNITSDTRRVKTGVYFTELNQKDLSVFHLIFAADDSEAGKHYNAYTIDFIEGQYNNDWKKEKFDVIEQVKAKFSEYSKRYLEQKIEISDFNSNEDNIQNKIIKLKEKKDLSLKKCIIDEIGFQTFKGNGFEPQYNYFKNGNTLEIRVELPGNVAPIIGSPECLEENTVITIRGEKKRDKVPEKFEENIYNSRDFGNFNLEIQFKTEDYRINSTIKDKKLKQGILFLTYELDENKKDDKITLTVDEEI